jgi:hypothetical protein
MVISGSENLRIIIKIEKCLGGTDIFIDPIPGLFFTLLGFLCSYWGIFSILPSNNPSNIHLQCHCSTKNEKKH